MCLCCVVVTVLGWCCRGGHLGVQWINLILNCITYYYYLSAIFFILLSYIEVEGLSLQVCWQGSGGSQETHLTHSLLADPS